MKRAASSAQAVEEFQGLYGPFIFSEKLLQEIWSRGDFSMDDLRTTDGRQLRILRAGRWNMLGGPDFKDARLQFDGGEIVAGDVELHLRAKDWEAHRHAMDANYDSVQLHVVLFPPEENHATHGGRNRTIPTLVLLPRLHHDLEEYAEAAAVESLAGRPIARVMEILRLLQPETLRAELLSAADARWRQKVHYARLRISKLGWVEACHHAALEILGYRFNRAPMLQLAGRYPLADWAKNDLNVSHRFNAEEGHWRLQGVRPANHPQRRLQQYVNWVSAVPDWPMRLVASADRLPVASSGASTAEVRRSCRMRTIRANWSREICDAVIGGTRLDNLVCDGWLPLLAAYRGKDLGGLWHHWFPGDLPQSLTTALRVVGVFKGRDSPACHGAAQGLLRYLLAHD